MRSGRYKLREVIQGVPIGHPTHPMFVHFPTALYPVAFALGLASRVSGEPSYGRAAAVVLGAGLVTSLGAALTGLVDWSGMAPGSTKRRVATRHMLIQISAQAAAIAALVLHLFDYGTPSVAAVSLAGVASLITFAGNWFGGVLVYRMGMRVGTGSSGGSSTTAEAA